MVSEMSNFISTGQVRNFLFYCVLRQSSSTSLLNIQTVSPNMPSSSIWNACNQGNHCTIKQLCSSFPYDIVPLDHDIATTLEDKHVHVKPRLIDTFTQNTLGKITQKRLLYSLVLSLFPAPFVESSERD